MLKKFTILSICIFLSALGQAQIATGNFSLKTQAQVDAFLTQHPNVTKVDGKLAIGVNQYDATNCDITDLSGFSELNEVSGELMVAGIKTITDLDFLANLNTVGGALLIDDDSSLVSIAGLSNLTSLGNTLAICMNENLVDLTGVQQLTTVHGDLFVFGNEAIESYQQLSNIVSIKGQLNIFDNPKITDLSGFENLTEVEGMIIIFNNPNLSDCTVQYFCNNLSVQGKFDIFNNATGCNNVEEVESACVLGVEDLGLADISLTPNPATTTLTLETGFQVEQVQVIDMTGNRISVKVDANQIDVSGFSAGIYTVQVNNNGDFLSSRFVIQ